MIGDRNGDSGDGDETLGDILGDKTGRVDVGWHDLMGGGGLEEGEVVGDVRRSVGCPIHHKPRGKIDMGRGTSGGNPCAR